MADVIPRPRHVCRLCPEDKKHLRSHEVGVKMCRGQGRRNTAAVISAEHRTERHANPSDWRRSFDRLISTYSSCICQRSRTQWGAMLHSAVNASSEQTPSPLVSKASCVVISYCLFLFNRASIFFFPHRCSSHCAWHECTNSDLSGPLVYWQSNRLPHGVSPTSVREIIFPLCACE